MEKRKPYSTIKKRTRTGPRCPWLQEPARPAILLKQTSQHRYLQLPSKQSWKRKKENERENDCPDKPEIARKKGWPVEEFYSLHCSWRGTYRIFGESSVIIISISHTLTRSDKTQTTRSTKEFDDRPPSVLSERKKPNLWKLDCFLFCFVLFFPAR